MTLTVIILSVLSISILPKLASLTYADTQYIVQGVVSADDGGIISGANVTLKGTKTIGKTNKNGRFKLSTQRSGNQTLTVTAKGYKSTDHKIVIKSKFTNTLITLSKLPPQIKSNKNAVKKESIADSAEAESLVAPEPSSDVAQPPPSSRSKGGLGMVGVGSGGGGLVRSSSAGRRQKKHRNSRRTRKSKVMRRRPAPHHPVSPQIASNVSTSEAPRGDEYKKITEHAFKDPTAEPLSTFSIDVDTASYANLRRFIQNGNIPPKDAVKLEEMINYFDYNYAGPKTNDVHPFSVKTELADAPWNPKHKLMHIGLQGRKIDSAKLPPSNLVFLLDVSGSMNGADRLPLLKQALMLLSGTLRSQDKVSIVVYAGSAGLVLPPTSGAERRKIIEAFSKLRAGGSTAGGAGIKLAYKIAKDQFIKGGNNRVILATDGDFNVGVRSQGELVRLIEDQRKSGVFLTVLGFGRGNYRSSTMSELAEKGNGNHAYIDSILEAQKVLVSEMGGTLFTIAKDVKIQVEFNPKMVGRYRLLGYQSRILAAADFNNDKKDAGELGAGHNVTALYELIPPSDAKGLEGQVDALKYQQVKSKESEEWLTVKLRYKKPDGDKSILMSHPHKGDDGDWREASEDFRFSAGVASFGMMLRDSKYLGENSRDSKWDHIQSILKGSAGSDQQGYRAELLDLVKRARKIKP